MTKQPAFKVCDLNSYGRGMAEVAVLQYPGAQSAAILGITDFFSIVNSIASRNGIAESSFIRVSHWRSEADIISCVFDTHSGFEHEPRFVLIPPALDDAGIPTAMATEVTWLTKLYDQGATLGSVCLGAFVLGETGLLSGRPATTHTYYADIFKDRFPDVQFADGDLVVDDGNIITAAGVMCWVELCACLVGRIFGPVMMAETARFFAIDTPTPNAKPFNLLNYKTRHSDIAILRVQQWLQDNGAKDASTLEMAKIAGLEPRTFLRRFVKSTGMKPREYCQTMRVARARDILELTNDTIEAVAWKVGYRDPSAFSKIFHRLVGISPGEYRHRVNPRAKGYSK